MKIYNDYVSLIEKAMDSDRKNKASINGINEELQKGFGYHDFRRQVSEKRLLPSLNALAEELQLKPNFDQGLGAHPDFAYLREFDDLEKHYIVSMFIDIKGSTNLFKRYEPETVSMISNAIQTMAIHICLIFGGYVHRLQGDGLFVYFGGKNITIDQAVKQALNSSSVFTYFMQNDLGQLLIQRGIEKISTRIGIDLGYNKDVVWLKAGIGEISEITTCSLHTSLASKMQSNAKSNGIVIGDYIKENVSKDVAQELMIPVCHRTNDENDRYIYRIPEENFTYIQYDFKWLHYLKRQNFIATDLRGNLNLKKKRQNQHRIAQNIQPIAIKNTPYFEDQATVKS